MIKSKNLSKSYKGKKAVDDISFEVESGKVTGFLGPNGAGKSTTIRLMLDLDNGGGTTTFDNKQLHQYSQPSKIVGILLEAKAFHPTRTASSHLKVLANAGNIPLSRVDEVLDIVGLKSQAKKSPGNFSLGMSQRLGIAAAILGDPKYLLLDEPANGLDPEGIVWLRQFLKDYVKGGNAVFVSSHLLSEMSQMAENVIVIGKGKLLADTSIKDLINKGESTATYIRVDDLAKLEKLLKSKKIDFDKAKHGLLIHGIQSDTIGQLAFSEKLTVLELENQKASLEEVFLELTGGSEEFAGSNSQKKGGNKP